MTTIAMDEPVATAVVEAIRSGDVPALKRLLAENPTLAQARLRQGDQDNGTSRTLLHIATDWPGHFPSAATAVTVLAQAGADVNAWSNGPSPETPLHWAASSDDVDALDALVDAGADVDARREGGRSPLGDATVFGQWRAARRLVEHGAKASLWDAATLGLMDRIEEFFAAATPPTADEINHAFWGACHGGQRGAAEYLLDRGADPNWVPWWEEKTALDAAERSEAGELAEWLRGRGARSADELS